MQKISLSLLVIALGTLPIFNLQAQSCLDSSNTYFFNYNGHRYAVVQEQKTWSEAAACARELGYFLVHIEDSAEQQAIADTLINGANVSRSYTSVLDGGGAAYVWIGATDKSTEGQWQWDGDDTLSAVDFWTGQGSAGAGNGSAVGGAYHNWGGSNQGAANEPDDFQGQDGGAMALQNWPFGQAFEWNDIDLSNNLYFIMESASGIGLEEEKAHEAMPFTLFPNPAQDKLHLKNHASAPLASVQIMNTAGQVMWENNNPGTRESKLDISFLEKGVYSVVITTKGGQRHVLRMVVK